MKMKEAEARTGLVRKNIRYYESEELLVPRRTEGNRYRDYSEEDIGRLLEIKLFRQLGIPIKDIRRYYEGSMELKEMVHMRRVQIDGELDQLKRMGQMCTRLEERKELEPVETQELLREIQEDEKNGFLFQNIRKDWALFQKEIHKQFIYIEPAGDIVNPGDYARETAVFAAKKQLDYETVSLETTYALVRLEGIQYQASLSYGFGTGLARLPLVKLSRCTPPKDGLPGGLYVFFYILPTLVVMLGIVSCFTLYYFHLGNGTLYRIILLGSAIASGVLYMISRNFNFNA